MNGVQPIDEVEYYRHGLVFYSQVVPKFRDHTNAGMIGFGKEEIGSGPAGQNPATLNPNRQFIDGHAVFVRHAIEGCHDDIPAAPRTS